MLAFLGRGQFWCCFGITAHCQEAAALVHGTQEPLRDFAAWQQARKPGLSAVYFAVPSEAARGEDVPNMKQTKLKSIILAPNRALLKIKCGINIHAPKLREKQRVSGLFFCSLDCLFERHNIMQPIMRWDWYSRIALTQLQSLVRLIHAAEGNWATILINWQF